MRMETQKNIDFQRIAEAIAYIKSHYKSQPNLDEIARAVHMSPYHFQRLFTDWAGTSPKKFLQYISIGHAKSLLKEHQATLFDTAAEIGLSGTGRLHDLFVGIEGMTPAEYKNGGENLSIHYSLHNSPFGQIMVASTDKGICSMAFVEDRTEAKHRISKSFPWANVKNEPTSSHLDALKIFNKNGDSLSKIKLHLKGTAFQLKVWESLLKIPLGKLSTYRRIADDIGNSKASRAVGTAIGGNPVAYLIPCHRVILSTGETGGYRWQPDRKTAMLAWEAAQIEI